MGAYVYRITSTRVMCSDGEQANVAVYAYKPYSDWSSEDRKVNRQMHFRSGAAASQRLANEGRLTGRVVYGKQKGDKYVADAGATVFKIAKNRGTFVDDDVPATAYLRGVNPVS